MSAYWLGPLGLGGFVVWYLLTALVWRLLGLQWKGGIVRRRPLAVRRPLAKPSVTVTPPRRSFALSRAGKLARPLLSGRQRRQPQE